MDWSWDSPTARHTIPTGDLRMDTAATSATADDGNRHQLCKQQAHALLPMHAMNMRLQLSLHKNTWSACRTRPDALPAVRGWLRPPPRTTAPGPPAASSCWPGLRRCSPARSTASRPAPAQSLLAWLGLRKSPDFKPLCSNGTNLGIPWVYTPPSPRLPRASGSRCSTASRLDSYTDSF